MASAALFASPKPSTLLPKREEAKGRDAIYVAAVPLRAPRGPAQMLVSTAYALGAWDLQHFMVIVKPSCPHPQAFVYDFQPQDPENFDVMLSALFSGQVAGVVLKRSLKRIPKIRCWFVGFCNVNGIEAANNFSEEWSTQLVVGKHDCRHYTNRLVEHLTGKQSVLGYLRPSFNG
ncbi:uncharacterized protein LOC110035723 [Phalaenopsis equestris]|uniref:uncharacterized protein LOC110035723 n=1 Tax=Phalaenopsis equestris TaxID=78828 RepID=UPI0009E47DF8|nr:uncharacterized protein LOC110035723 [Phalaenopsis equestris]